MKKNALNINLLLIFFALLATGCNSKESMGYDSLDVGQSGSMARFAIYKNHLFTVDRQSLRVFDISNQEKPVFKIKKLIGFDIETIFSKDDLLFIGAETAMYVYRVSNPENPIQLTCYSHIYSCDPVVVNDNYAFVTLSTSSTCGRWENQLHILDISEITDIKEITIYDMVNPKGLGLKNNVLYLCNGGYLEVYDITNLNNIILLQSIENSAFDVIPLEKSLLALSETGFYQYSYDTDNTLSFLSKIEK
ncbi:MAG: hypothetical protein JXB17_10095 [Bacteroidales bacterium]|nr:hypothetical protein [Bacteroidales bacterium]